MRVDETLPQVEYRALQAQWLFWTIGLAGTAVLSWFSARGTRTPGCAFEGFECDSVLASSYSRLLGVPLTTYAMAYFGVAALFLIIVAFLRRGPLSAFAALIVVLVTVIGISTAVWSLDVMLFRLNQVCLWCLVVHAANSLLFCASLVLVAFRWRRVNGDRLAATGRGLHEGGLIAAIVVAVLLAVCQHKALNGFHDQPELTVVKIDGIDSPLEIMDTDAEPISTFKGRRDAEHRVAMVVCFSCKKCKSLNQKLNEICDAHPGQLRVDVRFAPTSTDRLSSLAIAVAEVDPKLFATFSDWLFENQQNLQYGIALKEAQRLVGSDALAKALLEDERNRQRLAKDIDIARKLHIKAVPQLVISEGLLTGELNPKNVAAVLDAACGWVKQVE
jgi:uncharacterized membrane protein